MRRVTHRQQEGARLVCQEIIEAVEREPVRLRIRFEADFARPTEAEFDRVVSLQSGDLLVDVVHVVIHVEEFGGRCWEQARHRKAADTLANVASLGLRASRWRLLEPKLLESIERIAVPAEPALGDPLRADEHILYREAFR